MRLGFSPMATIAIIGAAAALGDAGSPASDSTLGPTSGLSADGQHHHIWDTCVPTFIFYNIPLVIFGWIARLFYRKKAPFTGEPFLIMIKTVQ